MSGNALAATEAAQAFSMSSFDAHFFDLKAETRGQVFPYVEKMR